MNLLNISFYPITEQVFENEENFKNRIKLIFFSVIYFQKRMAAYSFQTLSIFFFLLLSFGGRELYIFNYSVHLNSIQELVFFFLI